MAGPRVEEILRSVYHKVRDLLEIDRFYVALYDPRRKSLEFPLVEPADGRSEGEPRPFKPPLDDDVEALSPDQVIARREPVLREHGGDRPLSWLGMPLIAADQVLGAMVMENRHRAGVFAQKVGFLSTVAREAAIALTNAGLRDRLERKIANLNALYEMGQELTSSIQVGEQEIVELIYKWASRVMDTKNMYIALYDNATDEVRFDLAYQDDRRVDVETELGWQARRAGNGRTEWIIRHRQPLLDETKAKSAAWYQAPGRKEYIGQAFASWVGVPMVAGRNVLGVIATYHATDEYVYDDGDVQVLTMLANQAAVAFENARLYTDMEQRVEERTRAWQQEQERADAAEKLTLMSSVAAEFAHRMNNLAGTIPVRVDLARENLDPDDPKDARVIKQLESIASDAKLLLDAAQEIKRTTDSRAPEFVDVSAELEIALGRARSSRPETEVRIEVNRDLAPDLPLISVERSKLLDTLVSIIQNGLEAMPRGGVLTLSTRLGFIEEQCCIEVVVSDTGIGIPAADLPKIFNLFFTTKERGLGFGLWRDRVFVKNLGGDIEVNSAVGVGTTLTIKIPVHSGTSQSTGGQNV